MMFHRDWIALLLTSIALCALPARGDVVWAPLTRVDSGGVTKLTGRIIAGDGGTRVEPARVAGRIVNILRREGEVVKVGTPLFEISSSDCTALAEEKRVAEARGLTDLLEATNRRSEQLGLRLTKGRCLAVATHSGTIVKRQVELGAAFNTGDPLLTILDTRNLIVELDVPERLLTNVREGQKARFSLAAQPGKSFPTEVDRVVPTMDSQTRTTKVRLKGVPLPDRTSLDALAFAEIVGSAESGLLRAPTSAFVFHQNRQYVVKKASPHPLAVPVEIVDENETDASVRATGDVPLREGDEVAVKGAIFLFNEIRNGDPEHKGS